jgi:hypothetical protein
MICQKATINSLCKTDPAILDKNENGRFEKKENEQVPEGLNIQSSTNMRS